MNGGLYMVREEMNFMTLILRMKTHFQVRICEWLMAAILFSWGIQLLGQPTMFADNQLFVQIRTWISQPALGFLCLFYAIARAAVLVINGAWRPSPHLRALAAFIGAGFWLQISFGIAHSGRIPISLAVYPWFIILEGWTVFRAATEARVADERARGGLRAVT